MIRIRKFVFNPFQENTYVLSETGGACLIIDPGCYDDREQREITNYIAAEKLLPARLIYTHCHIDHMVGNNFICAQYGLKPEIHREGLTFFRNGHQKGLAYGFYLEPNTEPGHFLEHGELIRFGNAELQAVYTPGHIDGHLCFICHQQKFVITGDVLFRDSIGRTDFETGDYDRLMESIHNQLFTLGEDFTVYSGHGPETTIGYEKVNNPFIRF